MRAVAPADLNDVYTNPRAVLAGKAQRGEVHKVARGVYVAVPDDVFDPYRWRPGLEAAGAAVAATIFKDVPVVAAGLTAARLLQAMPRARARVTLAAPRRHRDVHLTDRPVGIVEFIQRDVYALATTTVATELGPIRVTTPEQTIIDLACNSTNAEPAAIEDAIHALLGRVAWDDVVHLARTQRGATAALTRLRVPTPAAVDPCR
jgi:predicted transcriptional regulator of viral defense system